MTANSGAHNPSPPTHGVFISKGMRVGVPPGGLKISLGAHGRPHAEMTLYAALDVTPHWLGVALSHLAVADEEHSKLSVAWQRQINDQIAGVLEAEFIASMQAIMAAAIGIDAFYAAVKEHVTIPEATQRAWHEKRTARHRQVSEVLRRGFRIDKRALPNVRRALMEIYRFRDLAVHPDPKLAQPLVHPDLGVGTEWRFVYFRFENAKAIVQACLNLVVQLQGVPSEKYPALKQYAEGALLVIQPLVQQWESRYGRLLPRSESTTVNS